MRLLATRFIAVAICAVLVYATIALRTEMIKAQPLLPVLFDHADHTRENCIECHHNVVDDTGTGICYACHHDDPALKVTMLDDFHDFCRGCHLERTTTTEVGGPLRRCSACHASGDGI